MLGTILQGSIGFGLGLVAAPLLILINPKLIPGPLLCTGTMLALLILIRQRRSVHLGGLGWALVGRVGGAILGALTLSVMPRDVAVFVLGMVILLGVGLSLLPWKLRPGIWTMLGAGTASGYMATLTSVGGPPIALVYQDSSGDRLRGTLSGFLMIGAFISLVALSITGHFGGTQLRLSFLILPGLIGGFIVSIYTSRLLDQGWTRPAVLTTSAATAVVCMVRQFV